MNFDYKNYQVKWLAKLYIGAYTLDTKLEVAMKIRETFDNMKNFVLSAVNSRTFLKIASATIVVASTFPRAALAIAAAVARLFNNVQLAQAIEYRQRKFTLIVTEHYKANLAEAPLPLLATSKNLPTQAVIAKGEDKEAIAKMRTTFLNNFPHLDSANNVANAHNRGASLKLADSMCLGGCFRAIKTCLNAKSEEELVGLSKQFEPGFDADAAALEYLYRRSRPACIKDKIPYEEMYRSFASLMNLKYVANSSEKFTFRDMMGEKDESTATRFNELPKGAHFVSFIEEGTKRHAAVLFKFDFGTYLFDPELGLMSTKDHIAAHAMIRLIEHYQTPNLDCESYRFSL